MFGGAEHECYPNSLEGGQTLDNFFVRGGGGSSSQSLTQTPPMHVFGDASARGRCGLFNISLDL